MTTDEPDEVPNLAQMNGILPGIGWQTPFLEEGFEEYIAPFIYPFEDEALLYSVLDQAHAQWHALFPDSDERDRQMFMAGVACVHYWWAAQSIRTSNEFPDVPWEDLVVGLTDVDAFSATTTVRLISMVHAIDDEAIADLDDAFADVVEGFDD